MNNNYLQINILATADNHGHIEKLPQFFQTIEDNFENIFSSEYPCLDLFMIVGDWFINPSGKVFKIKNSMDKLFDAASKDEVSAFGHYNLYFLNEFVLKIQQRLTERKKRKLKTILIPGNHCLEGGYGFFIDLIKYAVNDIQFLITNINYQKAKKENIITLKENIVISQNSINNEEFKVLILGVIPPTYKIIDPDRDKFLDIIDKTNKKTHRLNWDKDLVNTFEKICNQIDNFKSENSKSGIIILNHMGWPFSEKLIEKLSEFNNKNKTDYNIDLILNAHDHKTIKQKINDTYIISLGENNEMFESIKFFIGENGNKLSSVTYKIEQTYCDNEMEKSLKKLLKNDYEKNISINFPSFNANELTYKGARYKNNILVNFLTDSIFKSIKKYIPQVDLFIFTPVYVRGNLPINDKKANNFDFLNLFSTNEDRFNLYIGDIKGIDIINIVIENVLDNAVDEDRNAILQWSGLKFYKSEIIKAMKVKENRPIELLGSYILFKENGKYEKINPERTYYIALQEIILTYKHLPTLIKIKNSFQKSNINKNIKDLFYECIENNSIFIDSSILEEKIIS